MSRSTNPDIDGLVQERRNSIANALELRLSCTIITTADDVQQNLHACTSLDVQ